MRGLITPKNKINISTKQKILPANIVNKNTMLIRPIIEINNKNKKEKNSLLMIKRIKITIILKH